MNENNMYPKCTILYKTDNSDGWHYAIMSGDEKECSTECNKLKAKYNWYDYKCYVSGGNAFKRDIPFQNTMPDANYIHMCTDLIYNPFNNKFYYPKETMPYPKTRKRTVNNFEIILIGEGEDDENIWEPDNIDGFECGTKIAISFGCQKDEIITIAEDVIKDIPKFIKRLQTTGYSNLSIEEYTYSKFLAWEYKNKVRFIVQYYGDNEVETEVDKLIPKELFYKKFKGFYSSLEKYIEKHNELYKEFKLQERFLQNQKWEFDTSKYDCPQEYIYLNSINTKIKSFEIFQKNIKEKSKEHTIDFDTREKSYCYLANEYYYWYDENRIVRRLFYTYKEKEIIRFIKSKDFEYKKGMSLTDIYNQLLDKGYNPVIDCEYYNKNVLIYANGQVESKEATKEEIKELEQIIKKLAENVNDKENLTVSEFVDILKDHITYISFRDNKMKL